MRGECPMNTENIKEPSREDAAVINTVLDCNRPGIDNMKLQKILYFAAARWAIENEGGNKLLEENFQAWAYGPVIPSAYEAFRKYGSRIIEEFINHEGEHLVYREETEEYKCIQAISEIFQNHTGVEMSNISHAKDSPWHKCGHKEKIELKEIAKYFSDDLKKEMLYPK